ncbi:hypothetical protein RYX36_019640 [Vicia faba]
MASSETQPPQHPNYKTIVLKVSIHCQACKKKVIKILQGIYGVTSVTIDLKQQKVIVTGNVSSDVLIMKLTKTGKHAELWPETEPEAEPKPTDVKKKKQRKPENKEKEIDPETEDSEEIEIIQTSENNNETGKIKVDDTSKKVEVNGSTPKKGNGGGDVNGSTAKKGNGSGEVNDKSNRSKEGNATATATGKPGVVHVQHPNPEVRKQTVVLPAGPVPEKKVSVAVQFPCENNEEASIYEKTGSTGGTSSEVKKKKKKGKGKVNTNNNVHESVVEQFGFGDASGTGGSGNRSHGEGQNNFHDPVHRGSVPVQITPNELPPRHYTNQQYFPPQYYASPVYTVSHHTAYPSNSSYGAAYYAPPQPYQYAHVVNPVNEMEDQPRPYTYESSETYSSSQPSDSFVYFSDENPNACSVM